MYLDDADTMKPLDTRFFEDFIHAESIRGAEKFPPWGTVDTLAKIFTESEYMDLLPMEALNTAEFVHLSWINSSTMIETFHSAMSMESLMSASYYDDGDD